MITIDFESFVKEIHTQKFEEVKAFRCSFCKKLFVKPKAHNLCKCDPNIIHCGECKYYRNKSKIYTSEIDPAFDYDLPPHSCTKGHNNFIPRRKECKDFEFNRGVTTK